MAFDAASQRFLMDAFASYYRGRPEFTVSSADEREWGIERFGHPLFRHRRHPKEGLNDWLTTLLPLNAYHSLARYEHPDHRDMALKGRRSWDIFIDIDVKPEPRLDGTDHEGLADAWQRAKQQCLATLQTLEDDLGLVRPSLNFSGAKGFHLRVEAEPWRQLGAEARAEIGRIITGSGTEASEIFATATGFNFQDEEPAGGLRRRIWLAMTRLRRMAEQPARDVRLVGLCNRFNATEISAETVLDLIRDQSPSNLRTSQPLVWSTWFRMARYLACPSVDQAALADASRLGRLQGSLNGKTGLQCRPIAGIDELEAFEPLRDANPHPLDRDVAIVGLADRAIPLDGTLYRVQPETVVKVPYGLAVVFVSSGSARVA